MEISLAATPLNSAQQQALNEALNIAMGAKDLDMMINAVDSGADANILMFRGIQNYQLEWVKTAVDHGANVNATMRGISHGDAMQNYNDYPVFFWLTRYFDADVGDYLLSKGADIDALSPTKDTALMAAVRTQSKSAIKYLAEHGADALKICADQKIPLKELEDDSNWSDKAAKVPLIKAMLETLKNKATGTGNTVTAPANDPGASATKEAIEVGRPLELKKKPHTGFEL